MALNTDINRDPSPVTFGRRVLSVADINSVDALTQLEPEWRKLERGLMTPFGCYDWVIAWWKHFREENFSVKDSLVVKVIRCGDRIVGIAPMMLTQRPSFGPLVFRQLQFLGADPNVTELRGVSALPGWEELVYEALCRQLAESADTWDCAVLSGIPEGLSLEGLAHEQAFEYEQRRVVPSYTLDIASKGWTEFKSGLPRNIKESLRKCYNAPKRAGLELEAAVSAGSVRLASSLDDFLRLHKARAGRSDTIAHRDVFDSGAARGFLREVCERFAERGALRLFELRLGERVVASRLGFLVGDTLYLYYSGYDLEFGRFSVTTRVVAEAIQWAIREGLSTVHLSTGADRSKLRFRPEQHASQEVRLVSSGLRARLACGIYDQALRVAASEHLSGIASRYLYRRAEPNAAPASSQ